MGPEDAFYALGHTIRLQIFRLLRSGTITTCCGMIADGENAACVTDLVARLPKAQSTISHHLKILEFAGLIRSEKRGQFTVYSADQRGVEALRRFVLEI